MLGSRMPLTAILETLAKAGEPLTKHQLQKRTLIATQSVYDWIPKMQKAKIIEVKSTGKSRTGLDMKYYGLTERGWVIASGLITDPEGLAHIPSDLRGKLTRLREIRERDIEMWIHVIRQVYVARKAAPGWRFMLLLQADKDGNVKSGMSVGFPKH